MTGATGVRPVRPLKGYFGVGVEGISKAMNLGAILRTAHAFGASFAFTVDAHHKALDVFQSDTARSLKNVPYFGWDGIGDMALPEGCSLVGIELTEDAVIEHCREFLANFKVPRSVEFVSELPRNATGKVLKRVLRGEPDPAAGEKR